MGALADPDFHIGSRFVLTMVPPTSKSWLRHWWRGRGWEWEACVPYPHSYRYPGSDDPTFDVPVLRDRNGGNRGPCTHTATYHYPGSDGPGFGGRGSDVLPYRFDLRMTLNNQVFCTATI
jgi:hypothetical protein